MGADKFNSESFVSNSLHFTGCIEPLVDQGILYNGLTFKQLAQKWEDYNLPLFAAGLEPGPQSIDGIFILRGTLCPPSLITKEFDINVASGDKILGATATFADIAFPIDDPQTYWGRYDPLLDYFGIDTLNVTPLEKAVIGTTFALLGQLDYKLTLNVDGCPLDATATFVQSGLWEPVEVPGGFVYADSVAHLAGFFFLLPALTEGLHDIKVGVEMNGAHVGPGIVSTILPYSCNFLNTFHVCVGGGPCAPIPTPVSPPIASPVSPPPVESCGDWFFLLEPICWVSSFFTGLLHALGIV